MSDYKTIDELIQSKGVKINHIAKALDVTTPTLRKMRRDPSLMTFEDAGKLAEALDVGINVVLGTALKQIQDQEGEG